MLKIKKRVVKKIPTQFQTPQTPWLLGVNTTTLWSELLSSNRVERSISCVEIVIIRHLLNHKEKNHLIEM